MLSDKWIVIKDDILTGGAECVLREDMFHAACNNYVIDSDWCEVSKGGTFITLLVKDYDWRIR